MSISRRNALATGAAAIVTGATVAPLAIKAAGVKAALGDNHADLEALRLAWRVVEQRSFAADDVAEDAKGSTGQPVADHKRVAAHQEACAAYERFMDTPATSTRGVLAKLTCLETEQEWAELEQEWSLDSIMICAVRRDLERLARVLAS
jgi:hypothetical protein